MTLILNAVDAVDHLCSEALEFILSDRPVAFWEDNEIVPLGIRVGSLHIPFSLVKDAYIHKGASLGGLPVPSLSRRVTTTLMDILLTLRSNSGVDLVVRGLVVIAV